MEKDYRLKKEIAIMFKGDSKLLKIKMKARLWFAGYGIYPCDLEEVPSKIRLKRMTRNKVALFLRKKDSSEFTIKERVVCEKALNADLVSIEHVIDVLFPQDRNKEISIFNNANHFKEYLQQYLARHE